MLLFLGKLLISIFTSDFYILLCGALTAVSVFYVCRLTGQVDEEVKLCRNDPNKRFAADLAKRLNTAYNFFTTMITIFPLLGMLGTVKSLIALNLATEEIAQLQTHFFDALTSTAWGIIFAIGFKLANSFIEYRIINQIETAQKILEDEPLDDTLDAHQDPHSDARSDGPLDPDNGGGPEK